MKAQTLNQFWLEETSDLIWVKLGIRKFYDFPDHPHSLYKLKPFYNLVCDCT
jgi:hypothetical protein